MVQPIHLYIGTQEVDFPSPPDILYTYQEDDLTNPTVVKNSFTKTITIEGTPTNNQLFGQFWNVERLQGSNGGGASFNASKKAPFTLYLDHDVYESGYVKLNKVNVNGRSISYDITLYGGLGDFFYNLSINADGDELKLKDLDFGGGRNEFDFTININTVKEAWDALKEGTEGKWQKINFMTAYNGTPSDFDASKMIVNTDGTSLVKTKYENSKYYGTKDGFVLADLPDEMTEWETRDLRSYLQRPCVRMKEIIKACCDQKNNGGYNVVLDEDFFNSNNPYYEDTWLTLPMIQSLEYSSEEQILDGATLIGGTTSGDVNGYMYQPLTFDLGEFSQEAPSSINIKAKIKAGFSYYKYSSWMRFMGPNTDNLAWGDNSNFGSLFCQIIALNGEQVVAASETYNLTSPIRHNGKLYYGHNGRYDDGHKYTPYLNKPIYNVLGLFNSNGFTGEYDSTPYTFSFHINGINSNITSLKMVYYWGANKDKMKKASLQALFSEPYYNYKILQPSSKGWSTLDSVTSYTSFDFTSDIKAVLGESIGRTGTQVTKSLLLSTEGSPCDYLLSYTKMFGLYYTKDETSNTIYIQTRKSFYKRDEVEDLSELIDRGSNIEMTPLTFDTKWYQFIQEMDETEFSKNYNLKRGVDFGCKIVNTGYEFTADKKNLLEDNKIKSGIEGLEKSKYFTEFTNDLKARPFFGYSMTYSLYNGEDSTELTASTRSMGNVLPINENDGMKYYDLFPKLQFHDEKNGGTDGNNVLVFFNGFKTINNGRTNKVNYILSDDSAWQTQLNEGTPCWLFTSKDTVSTKRICYFLDSIPVFERYKTTEDSDKVSHSLDFGASQDLYVPSYSITDDVNIYANFWKTYLEDLYDVNNRILKCNVKLGGKPSSYWLRKFYWFDNTIWRITKINDWNVSSYDTTEVEFVKVQDISNYTSVSQGHTNSITLTSNMYEVKVIGGRIVLTVTPENGGDWRLICPNNNISFSQTSGTGTQSLFAIIGNSISPTYRYYYITAIRNDNGEQSKITIQQNYSNSTTIASPRNKYLIVGYQGGDYTTEFEWKNQEDNRYIDEVVSEGDITLDEVDITSQKESNIAIVKVAPSLRPSVASKEITYVSKPTSASVETENVEVTTYIDQLPQYLEFDKDGGTNTLTFQYCKNVEFTSVPFWISNIESDGNGTYTFTAIPNYYETEREDEIVVINTLDRTNTATFSVKQGAGELPSQKVEMVSPNNLYFNVDGGSQFINVSLQNPWTVTESLDWITLSTNRGDGASIIMVNCDANTGEETRSGNIEVYDTISNITYTVSVAQKGSGSTTSFTVSPTSFTVPSSGGYYDVNIVYQDRMGDIVYIASDDALSNDNIVWRGEIGTVRFYVDANSFVSSRVLEAIVSCEVGSRTITFNQAGFVESASAGTSALTYTYMESTKGTTLNSNVPWYATVSDTWLSVSPTSGTSGSHNIYITATENRGEARDGSVNIYSKNSNNLLATINIHQNAFEEVLEIEPDSLEFDAEGGTLSFRVTSNVDWTITEIE